MQYGVWMIVVVLLCKASVVSSTNLFVNTEDSLNKDEKFGVARD